MFFSTGSVGCPSTVSMIGPGPLLHCLRSHRHRCKRVFYCSADCQKDGWADHKSECGKRAEDSEAGPSARVAASTAQAGPSQSVRAGGWTVGVPHPIGGPQGSGPLGTASPDSDRLTQGEGSTASAASSAPAVPASPTPTTIGAVGDGTPGPTASERGSGTWTIGQHAPRRPPGEPFTRHRAASQASSLSHAFARRVACHEVARSFRDSE